MIERRVCGPFSLGGVQVVVVESVRIECARDGQARGWWAYKQPEAVVVWDERGLRCFDLTGAGVTRAAVPAQPGVPSAPR